MIGCHRGRRVHSPSECLQNLTVANQRILILSILLIVDLSFLMNKASSKQRQVSSGLFGQFQHCLKAYHRLVLSEVWW